MVTRRGFLKLLRYGLISGAALGGYAFIIEPGFLLRTTHYELKLPDWIPGLSLRLVVLADPHLVEPHMPLSRWERIIALANELDGDLALLLGDYAAGHFWRTGTVKVADAAKAASRLGAPLGVYSINGNHDWWDDRSARGRDSGPPLAEKAMADNGIPTLSTVPSGLARAGCPSGSPAPTASSPFQRGTAGSRAVRTLPPPWRRSAMMRRSFTSRMSRIFS